MLRLTLALERFGQEWQGRVDGALAQEDFARRVFISGLFALFGCVVNFAAIYYATLRASNWVTDLWLSNTPAFNTAWTFVYATWALIAFCTLVLVAFPARIPFALNSLGLFWTIRSAFVCLTHIAMYPEHGHIEFGTTITNAFFGDDLFFSAHTAVPLLFAFIFGRHIVLWLAFIMWSIFFAAVVLLGHIHYSIDVAAAFFITYPIYLIGKRLFRDA